MNKIRNHGIGAALTAVAMAAVLLTGCGEDGDEDCREDESMALMTVAKPAPVPPARTVRVVPAVRPAPPVKPGKPKTIKIEIDGDCD